MKINEIETLVLKNKGHGPALKFIQDMYEKYPRNPLNNREFGIVYGQGEDMQVAFFELAQSVRGPDWVEIRFVHTVPHRAGVGTRAMKEMQNMAQEAGVKLHLFAWDKGVVSQSKLRKFYTKTGFKQPKRNTFTWEPQ